MSAAEERKLAASQARSMQSMTDLVSMRLDGMEKVSNANAAAIKDNATAIDKLTVAIEAQSSNIERLERAVSALVVSSNEQRQSIDRMVEQQNRFLSLAERQADIIGNLTEHRAA